MICRYAGSANSNDAVHISLVEPAAGSSKSISTFHPKFTYPIFGDEESIFGYQGLKIHLKYHACDMRPNVQVTYDKKFKSIGDTNPTDIQPILEEFLPAVTFDKSSNFEAQINDANYKNWKPRGELLKTITAGDHTYEIWKGSLSDKAVQQFIKRIQTLVLFFIEGGSFINIEEPEWSLERWTVFLLFKKSSIEKLAGHSPYVFMGYCTVYKYFLLQTLTPSTSPASKEPARHDFQLPYPNADLSDIPCRSRISQFVILPPFQAGGNGGRFYEAIFDFYLKNPQTVEITVEDPNEQFDDLRDLNDLARLRQVPEFTSLRIDTDVVVRQKGLVPAGKIVDAVALDTVRRKMKIAPRQFSRLVEMQLLSLIPTSIRKSLLLEQKQGTVSEQKLKEHEYHLWQLFVKQRLYRHNKDSLIQLDRAERIDKLEDALGNVEADYARLLRKFDERVNSNSKASNGKRPASADEDGEPTAKKVRISEA